MEEVSAKTQLEKIRGFEKGFMATHLIHMGAKAGIFEKLNAEKEQGLSVAELARALGLHEPYLKLWCQTAYHFRILDCDSRGNFKLQPFLDEILGDRSHFRNYLPNIAVDVELVGKAMLEAAEYFKTGRTLEAFSDPTVSRAAYATTKNIYLAFIFMIFPKNEHLKRQLEQGIDYLDIGCGNGTLITQLAAAFPNSRFVGIGPDPHGLTEAKATIAQSRLQDRVSVAHVGGEKITYANQFDMASMVVTLHEIRPDLREAVVNNAYRALKTGGSILILDFPYPNELTDFRDPIYDYGIMDQFYETFMGSVHLTSAEQTQLLARAGFENIQRRPVGKGMFDFITASK
jgi:ubiquinone/menaquinone biosynthesis C-methylase UbiE